MLRKTILKLLRKTYEVPIDRVENETSIPESEKRIEKYSTK